MIASDIRVRIGRRTIVDGVDLSAQPGRVTAIVGPNGSGKSTLLRALTGELRFDGSILLNGRALQNYTPPELASVRGVLQQASTVAFPFTVREIVGMGLAAGLAAGDASVPEQALAAVDLRGFADRPFHHLSGGEQQRVQLARVLAQVWPIEDIGEPRWLMLDEPVSSLDIGHQSIVMECMKAFAARGGGVITVMHDLNLTAMYADHVILMKAGCVLASGPPQTVLADASLSEAYASQVRVNAPPPEGIPYILPQIQLLR
ncbi:heme ABC transporter ATP-binding protein [Sulfitobacter sp. D35]|uniref:heme ABC transporter ATP-binding protein n=1 Tax=Sulfitobacter sp. D35 TaxID=3083252 RepID=UPI00296ECD39|nr:heme ABC transporter ATP-binding protein [Sulfitobacter sp. D35]MDW4498860.1 heme ABC transporter ATP-binding protein [Sulfitobacter sp. D35]